MTRSVRTVVAGLVAALLAPALAGAAEGPRLIDTQSAKFPERSWVLSLPKGSALRNSEVDLRENGRRVEDFKLTPGDQAGPRTFGVVLAIDSSESMHSGAIDDAMAAAREFAARRSARQQLGLIFFNRDATVALPLTSDKAKIEAALANPPELHKGTRIFDAGQAAIAMLEKARIQAGTVVMLSDGGDVGSKTTGAALAEAARKARVRIYTVGLQSPSYDPTTLASVAEAGRGAYSEGGSREQLRAIYAALGEQLAAEYLISYRSLAPLGADVQVEARVAGMDAFATANYATPGFPEAAVAKAEESTRWGSAGAAMAAIGIVALLLLLALYLVLRGPQVTVRQRINQYVAPEPESNAIRPGGHAVSAVSAGLERSLRRQSWWPKVVLEVELGGVAIPAGQFVALVLVSTIALVWWLISLGRPLAAAIVAFAPLAVHMVLSARTERRRRAFSDQLADNLQVVASAMRAGHTLASAFSVAAEDAEEPAQTEFRRIVADERLGVALEDAMTTVAKRMNSGEMEHVAVVVQLQREAGGNTAEIIDHVVDQLRYRGELRRTVRTLTAQGKLGGAVVTAMPIAMALLLSILSPGYLQPLLDTPGGILALGAAGISVAIGWLFIRKIVDIKV